LPVEEYDAQAARSNKYEQDLTPIELSERNGLHDREIKTCIEATAHGLQVRLPSLPGL
jgi:hypothetical protein